MISRLKAAIVRIALCLLARLARDDLEKTAAVGVLNAERNAANQAPTSREETAAHLAKDRF